MNQIDAYERVRSLSRFYKSVIWFVIVFAIFFINDCFTSDGFHLSKFHFSSILCIWGLILAVKAFRLFVFDQEWEQKMIDRELKKEESYFNKNQ